MAEVLCANCGRPNSAQREFCDFCGNPLDGALRVEGKSGSQGNDLLDSQYPASMADASRLDNLIPAPEEENQPSSLGDFQGEEILNGDSRLESLFADQDDDLEESAQNDPGHDEALNGESRLDDYLPVEEPAADPEPATDGADDSSRLDEYLPPEESEEAPPIDIESLSADRQDDFSRLDGYLTPESPQDQTQPDEAARLDDFFADDPFNLLDPSPSEAEKEDPFGLNLDLFTEPAAPGIEPSPADQGPPEEPLFTRDDFLSDSLSEESSDELKFPGSIPESEQPKEELPAEPMQSNFPEPSPTPVQPEEEIPPEPIDAGEWGFLDPSPAAEQPEEEKPPEPIDAGEWDFLDPSPAPEQPGEDRSPESSDAGEWDFLDPSPAPEQPGEESSPEPIDSGEWDFLDPASADGDQEDLTPAPESAEPDAPEDWSFLDPGPTTDRLDDTGEQEFIAEGDEDDAGWLDMLQDPESRQQPESIPEPTAEPPKPQTDWLDKIKRLNASSDLVDEDSSFPDWLSVTGKTAEFKGDDSAQGPDSSSKEVPDWLQLDDDESLDEFLRRKDLTNEEYKPKITTDSLDNEGISVDEGAPASGQSDSQHIKFPSWAEEEKKKDLKHQGVHDPGGTKEDALGSAEPLQVEEGFFEDLFSEELPDWLTAASSKEVIQPVGQDLAQGELPGWVEAMRPVVESTDASGLDEDEDYIENYGPLAGIPGVLPAEAEIGIDFDQAVKKPLDLLATKNHQDFVNLLKKLIKDENKSRTIQLPSPLQPQRILRWLIAAVLLVTIASTLIFSGSVEMELPATARVQGTGFNALYEEIETLYDGQPVLIAYDYQPAAAGELHTAAATVVDHLMEQGTFLTFVSTQPTGPALAEHFLDTTQSQHHYIHTQKYINLGYLPGESAGLLSFMISPQKIIPLAYDGSNAWDSPPLISVDGIGDFKMIMVITDDPNTAKIWIEQVGSRLDNTPLTMVVSAQVEPLIQPYFRTSPRQLAGYVAGIIDGMKYEQLTERPYLASKSWLPFNIGIVISVGIIFIGGMANGVLSLFSRHKEKVIGESK
ncbi:MAG TPA: hypothetical protein ENG59_06515 [Chloroflexi bacterium]|nr:hypothetical protein [Chloroflexota bacterium]